MEVRTTSDVRVLDFSGTVYWESAQESRASPSRAANRPRPLHRTRGGLLESLTIYLYLSLSLYQSVSIYMYVFVHIDIYVCTCIHTISTGSGSFKIARKLA